MRATEKVAFGPTRRHALGLLAGSLAAPSLVLQQMQDEGQSFSRMLGEPAAKEAFGAFMEKRKPDFSKV